MPAWAAVTEQVPADFRTTVVLLTVHTKGVVVVKVTTSPEDAVPWSVTGDWAMVLLASGAKVIVWATRETVKRSVGARERHVRRASLRYRRRTRSPVMSGLRLPN